MRTILLLVAAIATMAAATTTANAYDPATLALAESVAYVNVTGPCAGRITTTPTDTVAGAPKGTFDGYADLTTCDIEVAPDLSPARLCTVLAHERGHLERQDAWHSPDPNNIMYFSGPVDYPPCRVMTPRRIGALASRMAAAALTHLPLLRCRFSINYGDGPDLGRLYRCGRVHVFVITDEDASRVISARVIPWP